MKRFWGWLVTIGLIGAAAWIGLRLAERPSNTAVSSLLPSGTVALVHFPDFNKTIGQWHHSDIYRIYREPAVQQFLQKPASRANQPQGGIGDGQRNPGTRPERRIPGPDFAGQR